ncbi:MAG: hypothetical protein ACREFH_16600 [Stellaceae bacterium]
MGKRLGKALTRLAAGPAMVEQLWRRADIEVGAFEPVAAGR